MIVTKGELSFLDGHVFEVAWADVFGTRADEFVVAVLLKDVTCPAGDAAHRKDRRVKVERNAHQIIRRSRVEIDVREHSLLLVHQLLDTL